jgi:hypothetical protein
LWSFRSYTSNPLSFAGQFQPSLKLFRSTLEGFGNMPKYIRYPCPPTLQEDTLVDDVVANISDIKPFSKQNCPICMEPIEAITRIKPCQHIFHFDCIHSRVHVQKGTHKYCPCCRRKMTALQKIDGHGCCISTHSVSRLERPPTPPQVQSLEEEAAALAAAERAVPVGHRRAIAQELEMIEQTRPAAEQRLEQDHSNPPIINPLCSIL